MLRFLLPALVLACASCGGGDPFAKARSEQLDKEIKALLVPTGCTVVEDCHAYAIGHKACGGPRWYAVTCAPSTDTTKLEQLRLDVVAADDAAGGASDCSLELEPTVALCDGACVRAADNTGACP